MDIFSHAVAGAATGALFGHPVAGAVIAVLPDVVIFGKRREFPSELYNLTHSLIFAACISAWAQVLGGFGLLTFLCLLSHLVLDLPTHGKTWAPQLLWPSAKRFSFGEEWEWFNDSWMQGLFLTVTWSFVCVFLSVTGFRL